ncbi:MAG: HDOD domain-containing protein [Fuerstiella sp.]
MSIATNMSLDELIALDQVPTLPETAIRVIQVAQQADPHIEDLVDVVRTDPAIAGRILMFSNSALFGLRSRCSSIEAAILLLGTRLVRTLVLGFSLAQQTKQPNVSGPWFRRLWKESLFQASAAEIFGERVNPAEAPSWFLGGLLQDIGHLAMLNVFGDHYVEHVLEPQNSRARVELEAEHFGFTHVEVSVALCRRWGLDDELVNAISTHHSRTANVSQPYSTLMCDGLPGAACCSEYLTKVATRLDENRTNVESFMIGAFGITPVELSSVLADVGRRSTELAAGFSVEIGNLPPCEQILAKAQSVLVNIAVENHLKTLTLSCSPGGKAVANKAISSVNEDLSREKTKWLDVESMLYNATYLNDVLPTELNEAQSQDKLVGLLQIELPEGVELDNPLRTIPELSTQELVKLIKSHVRPSDQIVRYSSSSFIALLPGINIDVLSRIAHELSDCLNEQLTLSSEIDQKVKIGGVVVIPAGRTAASSDLVISSLQTATRQAQNAISQISMLAVIGKKTQPLAGSAAAV